MTVQMEAKLFRTPRPPAEKGGLTPERVRLHVYRQQLSCITLRYLHITQL